MPDESEELVDSEDSNDHQVQVVPEEHQELVDLPMLFRHTLEDLSGTIQELYKIHLLKIQSLVQGERVVPDESGPLLELVLQVLHEVLVVRRVFSMVLRVTILISSMIVIILLGAL